MPENAPNSPPFRTLSRRPSLEQLRTQAKDLLSAYRAQEPEAIAEVDRFERKPDPASFALHDAQRVLARSYGYQSWPRLKAFVDGVNIRELADAVNAGDIARVRVLLARRPELVSVAMAENNEHRAIHYAVLRRDPAMVRLLMEAGADARKGIYPHRDATAARTIAEERGYAEIVAVIDNEEKLRREEMSCPNATISPVQDQIAAAISGNDNAEAIRLLRTDGTLIHACDRDGAGPLHIAAQYANEEMVAWLLARGTGVNKADLNGRTPLDRGALAADPRNARAKHFPAIARLLLDRGAQMTIHAAVALGHAGRVEELVRAEPGVLRQINQNGGLLTLAVNHGQIEIVRLLLAMGADVDERTVLAEVEEPVPTWGMPLWYAALANEVAIAELLLDRGADANANVYASGWPLRNAWNHPDGLLKKLLLSRGAKPQPYMIAETHDIVEARRLLDSDSSQDLARELIWSAADHGCPEILELALPRLKEPPDDRGSHWILIQPIRGATGTDNSGHFACMRILLRYGIDPNATRYGQTALHFAAAYSGEVRDADRAAFAAMLLDYGARLDVRDDLLRSTPLGWACRWGRKKLVELLIERGAPIDEPDAEPWATPRAWAKKTKQDAILALLS